MWLLNVVVIVVVAVVVGNKSDYVLHCTENINMFNFCINNN
jgi:hypothetical protein